MNQPDLLTLFSDSTLLADFLNQLNKDYQSAGLEFVIHESSVANLNTLQDQIALTVVSAGQSNLLGRLLNRVDISELQIGKYKNMRSDLPFEYLLAELIIKRTLQKIILKKKLSP
jgi:hypothetical protein